MISFVLRNQAVQYGLTRESRYLLNSRSGISNGNEFLIFYISIYLSLTYYASLEA